MAITPSKTGAGRTQRGRTLISRFDLAAIIAVVAVIAMVPIAASAATIGEPTNNLGMVGYWTFDGPTLNWNTNTTKDISGNGNTGQLISMSTTTSPVAGKIGGALKFDGSNTYVSVQNSSSLDVASGGTVTMCAWVYSNTGPTASYQGILAKRQLLGSGYAYGINFATGSFQVYTAGASGVQNFSSYVLPTKKWTHVCGVISASPTALYVNGNLYGTLGSGGGVTSVPAATFQIGRSYSGGETFNGIIDDVRVYNRALSASEVLQLYHTGAANVAHSNTGTNAPLSNGLVGYWTFDGPSMNWRANTAADSSGNGNTGTLVNMSTTTSPVAGKIGGALVFNGSNQYVEMGDLFYSDQLTMCAWVKPKSLSANYGNILVKRNSSGTTSACDEWALYNNNTTFGYASWVSTGGATALSMTSSVVPQTGQWYHVCAVQNGNGNNGYLYVNGVQSGTATQTGVMNNSSCHVEIGPTSAGVTTHYYNGTIDDVRVYNRALSASEVQQLYLMGR